MWSAAFAPVLELSPSPLHNLRPGQTPYFTWAKPSDSLGRLKDTAEKPLLMRSRFQFVFPRFHFQNGGRRIKNERVIVMALGIILPAQGIYKQLGFLGQSPVQVFRLWSKGSKRCWQFSQAIKTALPRENFQLFQIHLRSRFSFV